MKTSYQIKRDDLVPPTREMELALFTCALQSGEVRTSLAALGKAVPEQLAIVHHTNPDDPPDIEALGLGWECTEFPPNQSSLTAVHDQWRGPMMNVPGFSQTGRDIDEIRKRADPNSYDTFYSADDEIEALKMEFLERVLGGAKSKDIPCNHVLLLDHRQQPLIEHTEAAIRKALALRQPRHIKLILLVAWQRSQSRERAPVPNVTVMYP